MRKGMKKFLHDNLFFRMLLLFCPNYFSLCPTGGVGALQLLSEVVGRHAENRFKITDKGVFDVNAFEFVDIFDV